MTTYPTGAGLFGQVGTVGNTSDSQAALHGAETVASSASDAETSAVATLSTAGFDPQNGAYVRSSDGRLSLRIGAFVQVRATASTTPDPSRRFEAVPVVARVYFQGNVAEPWMRYFVQTELAGQQNPFPVAPVPEAPRLLDIWLEAQPVSWFGVRVGMMRPAFTRSWVEPLQKLILFDRSEANAFFRTHGPLLRASAPGTLPTVAWDRDIGLQVSGAPAEGTLEYALGVFNGEGALLGRNGDEHLMPVVRLALNPLGAVSPEETTNVSEPESPLRLQLGVAGYANRYDAEFQDEQGQTALGSEEQKTIGVDLTVYGAGLHIATEAYMRWRRDITHLRHRERGAQATVGWMFWAPYLEAAARYSIVDPHVGAPTDLRQVFDGQFNYYYWQNHLKFALRYSYARNQASFDGGVPWQPMNIEANVAIQSVSLLTQVSF